MAAVEPAGEKITRHLQEALARLHEDLARVELWAGALHCFQKPVPDYTHAGAQLDKYMLPVHQQHSAGQAKQRNAR